MSESKSKSKSKIKTEKNTILAHVICVNKNEVDCQLDLHDANSIVKASVKSKIFKNKKKVVAGDKVSLIQSGDNYVVDYVFDRKNEINRIIVRERRKQVIASNCDCIIICTSVTKPSFKRGIIDRFLLRSFAWNIPAIVVFNKMDQWHKDLGVDLAFEEKRLKSLSVECFELSALNKDKYTPLFINHGFCDLLKFIENKTVIFLGQSGVGKSHLVSSLSGIDNLVLSGEVGTIGKGKHTTTWCEKKILDNFSLIDSPGIRSFAISDILKEDFRELWPDLQLLGCKCKFRDCLHFENTKGCFIQEKYQDDICIMSRVESFHQMYSEIVKLDSWQKKF